MHFFLGLFSPNVAYAAETFNEFLVNVNTLIVNPLIKFIFALAVVYFLYGVFQFLSNQDNEEKKTTGKSHMMWGIIGITIMMGVWFFLGVIINTFSIKGINPETNEVKLPDYIPPSPNNLNQKF